MTQEDAYKKDKSKDISSLSFEEALASLEDIVRHLESGETTLEDSISAYERGMLLQKHCEERLQKAQMRLQKISKTEDGKASVDLFDVS